MEENRDGFSDIDPAFLQELFGEMENGVATMMNVGKYKNAAYAIKMLRGYIDKQLSGLGVSAEYKVETDDPFDICFVAELPVEYGIDINNAELAGFSEILDNDDVISIEPSPNGRIRVIINFRNVKEFI